ncbi:hypothetical protein PHMEG_0002721 [Phytophthora megakarya]|uniref:C2H2-type domain-containing protein n=1 Tax=Phytophthora megakarya TaxID=4795 RepID=A0A225X015_9STRA|nr:hypothetical protein PHMEG_0002721 [Phytophthora megakarya]
MAPKPRPSLPACGYILLYLGVRTDTLEALQVEAQARTYIPVFKEVGVSLTTSTESSPESRRPRVQLGGVEQETHQDYPEKVITEAKKTNRLPASMTLALEEEPQLRVYDGCTDVKYDSKARLLDIPVGVCVIFRGDLVHNVVASAMENHRLLCYLAYQDFVWEADVVSNVLPKHFDCHYCGRKSDDSNWMRQHRRYCVEHPNAVKNQETRRAPPKRIEPWVCYVCGKQYSPEQGSSYRSHILRGHDDHTIKQNTGE